ncbi:MAG: hypothetical protein JOZ58_15665 [Acetobacteraceae bacterium]|nr:hypothetical protein [Acetobacteraceae bacterium]
MAKRTKPRVIPCSVREFVLKGRFADLVKLDLQAARTRARVRGRDDAALVALAHSAVSDRRSNFRAENRSAAEAGKCSDDTAARREHSAPVSNKALKPLTYLSRN